MKYIKQLAIIVFISFLGEMLNHVIELPIPASVYGMVILFLALCLKIVKPEQIQETADWLISVMSVMFVGPLVGIMNHYHSISGHLIPFLVILVVTTAIVMAVTGMTVQGILKWKAKKGGDVDA